MSRPTKDELIRALGDEFRISQNRNQAFDDAAAKVLGVNLTDLRCMDIIQRLGKVTAGELAREAGVTTGAVTAAVDRLERSGYARREHDRADRRRIFIRLTPAAERAVQEIWGPETQEWTRHFRHLTSEQLQVFLDWMREGNEIQLRHLDRIRAET